MKRCLLIVEGDAGLHGSSRWSFDASGKAWRGAS